MIGLILIILLIVLVALAYTVLQRWPSFSLERKIPHIIWSYWEQGWEQAPDLCHLCITSWRYHHPDWNVIQLSRQTISQYIPEDVVAKIHTLPSYQNRADYLRAALLKYHGGVWVDSTLFCVKPLSSWLPELQGGIFMFSFPYYRFIDKMTLTSNWFIAASKESYMMDRLYDEMVKYWVIPPTYSYYFWFHKLFDKLHDTDATFRSMWRRIPPINTIHSLMVGLTPALVMDDIVSKRTSVYKLNHRQPLHPVIDELLRKTMR